MNISDYKPRNFRFMPRVLHVAVRCPETKIIDREITQHFRAVRSMVIQQSAVVNSFRVTKLKFEG
jgi:hypothetical protein